MSLLMLSTIRKCLKIINEMVSNFCFRQYKEEWMFLHNKGLEPGLLVEPMKTRLMYFDLISISAQNNK